MLIFIFFPLIATAQYHRDTITPTFLYENKDGVLCRKGYVEVEIQLPKAVIIPINILCPFVGIIIDKIISKKRMKLDFIPLKDRTSDDSKKNDNALIGLQYTEIAVNQWEEHPIDTIIRVEWDETDENGKKPTSYDIDRFIYRICALSCCYLIYPDGVAIISNSYKVTYPTQLTPGNIYNFTGGLFIVEEILPDKRVVISRTKPYEPPKGASYSNYSYSGNSVSEDDSFSENNKWNGYENSGDDSFLEKNKWNGYENPGYGSIDNDGRIWGRYGYYGNSIDKDGNVSRNGNSRGRMDSDGNARDQYGNYLGRIDGNGNVWDKDGNIIGNVTPGDWQAGYLFFFSE